MNKELPFVFKKILFLVLMVVVFSLSIPFLTSARDANTIVLNIEDPNNSAYTSQKESDGNKSIFDIAALRSDVPYEGKKQHIIGSPLLKTSLLGFFLTDVWTELPVNNAKGSKASIGIFGFSLSFDVYPTRNFWFLGLEYDFTATEYKTFLHYLFFEVGYAFRPVKNLYLTPSLGIGPVLGSRSFRDDLPPVGFQMHFSVALSWMFYPDLYLEIEPKMFFGSNSHNVFSFMPLSVGLSYSY